MESEPRLDWVHLDRDIRRLVFSSTKRESTRNSFFLPCWAAPSWFVNFKSFFARVHGQLVEHTAIKSLEKLDKSRVTKNKPLPGRGDIDVIYKAKEDIYNIEIKSVQDPRKVTKKHIRQVLDASDYTRTLPVIWLPKAPNKMIVNRGGVTIICGNARQLVSYLN